MKRIIYALSIILISFPSFAQQDNSPQNLASTLLSKSDQRLNIGGYATIDMTTQFQEGKRSNTSLDVSRMIISMGYRFSDKTQFLTEVEFEHVKEVFVEQAFVNHSFSDFLNFRAGLLLVPMGIVNEYHEPTTFNGVLRPMIDNLIVPTTWREIGAGFTGRFQEIGLKYQLYLVNGFSSYGTDNKGTLNGSGFLRNGRQRGARAFASAPNLSARIDYYGIMGLKVGMAGYFGDTQSALFNNLDKTDEAMMARADSTVVGISMVGLDVRYSLKGFHIRGQWILSKQSNTQAYNSITHNDLASTVTGYYTEISYNLLKTTSSNHQLTPFFRYEHYDTHFSVDPGLTRQDKYNVNEFIFGLGWKPAEGAVFKVDTRLRKSKTDEAFTPWLNAGVGVWF
ncbi:MAG: hypothetical protein A2X22_05035 [Bacteroidetes bacterium GWF2_49_14]|nr:MAG: hypothetical protein A2X22_05035 [Bacteroidetes bacterium GWF2_49_14]HBB90604.1 hypothetical protein [Bacteroidales bacterium]